MYFTLSKINTQKEQNNNKNFHLMKTLRIKHLVQTHT